MKVALPQPIKRPASGGSGCRTEVTEDPEDNEDHWHGRKHGQAAQTHDAVAYPQTRPATGEEHADAPRSTFAQEPEYEGSSARRRQVEGVVPALDSSGCERDQNPDREAGSRNGCIRFDPQSPGSPGMARDSAHYVLLSGSHPSWGKTGQDR